MNQVGSGKGYSDYSDWNGLEDDERDVERLFW